MDFRRATKKQLVLAGSSYSFFSASISLRHHQRFLNYSNSRSSTMAAVSSLSLCSPVTYGSCSTWTSPWPSWISSSAFSFIGKAAICARSLLYKQENISCQFYALYTKHFYLNKKTFLVSSMLSIQNTSF